MTDNTKASLVRAKRTFYQGLLATGTVLLDPNIDLMTAGKLILVIALYSFLMGISSDLPEVSNAENGNDNDL